MGFGKDLERATESIEISCDIGRFAFFEQTWLDYLKCIPDVWRVLHNQRDLPAWMREPEM